MVALLRSVIASLLIATPALGRQQVLRQKTALSNLQDEATSLKFFEDASVDCLGRVRQNGELIHIRGDTGCHFPKDCKAGPEYCAKVTEPPCVCGDLGLTTGRAKTMIVLTQQYPGAYYHVLVEGFSRLTYVRDRNVSWIEDPDVIFHTGDDGPIGVAWARLLGINDNKQHKRLAKGCWKADTVIVPPTSECFNPNAKALQGMQSVLAHAVWPDAVQLIQKKRTDQKRPVALLVKRDAGTARSISNHEEVKSILEELGFDVQEFNGSNLPSIKSQCRLFYEADLVIGPHGAGFANLVCARKGAWFIEFQQMPHHKCYEALATKLDLHYRGIPTNMAHEDHDQPVDLEAVRKEAGNFITACRESQCVGGESHRHFWQLWSN